MENTLENFPTVENLQSEFKNKIIEVVNYIKKYSVYDVFAHFYFDYKISYAEENNPDERWLKSQKIMYLQIFFSCIEESNSNIKN